MPVASDIEPLRIGVIGVGAIAQIYFTAIERSPILQLAGVAARSIGSATTMADRYDAPALSVDALLAREDVGIILNLSPASEHDLLNARAISAAKHVYSEKPFTLSLASAERLARNARDHGVRVASAPDTFFGGTQQLARQLVDDRVIGTPVFGASFVGRRGIEEFHPNPAGFYQPGAEGPRDIGPYYITQWVNLLGPVRQVFASGSRGDAERVIKCGPAAGERFSVEVATSFNVVLKFDGASVTLVTSLDAFAHDRAHMEVFGTAGALVLPDPNHFGGTVKMVDALSERHVLTSLDRPFSAVNRRAWGGREVADYRGVGLVDLALAIRLDEPHRTGPELFVHVVEVMDAIIASAASGTALPIQSEAVRPPPVGSLPRDALLAAMMISPSDLGGVTPG